MKKIFQYTSTLIIIIINILFLCCSKKSNKLMRDSFIAPYKLIMLPLILTKHVASKISTKQETQVLNTINNNLNFYIDIDDPCDVFCNKIFRDTIYLSLYSLNDFNKNYSRWNFDQKGKKDFENCYGHHHCRNKFYHLLDQLDETLNPSIDDRYRYLKYPINLFKYLQDQNISFVINKIKNFEFLKLKNQISIKNFETNNQFCKILDNYIDNIYFDYPRLYEEEIKMQLYRHWNILDNVNSELYRSFKSYPHCLSIYYGCYYSFRIIFNQNREIIDLDCHSNYSFISILLRSSLEKNIIPKIDKSKKLNMLEFILEKFLGYIVPQSEFYDLIRLGKHEEIDLFLKYKDIYQFSYNNAINGIINQNLTIGQYKILDIFLKNGFNPYVQSIYNASEFGNYKYIRYLINKGFKNFDSIVNQNLNNPLKGCIECKLGDNNDCLIFSKILIDNINILISKKIIEYSKQNQKLKITAYIKHKNEIIKNNTEKLKGNFAMSLMGFH